MRDAAKMTEQLSPHWEWRRVTCSCCGNEFIGMRKLVTQPPCAHQPLYCIVGLQVSVN